MSMYNLLFGQNPMSGLLMSLLGIDEESVPRFRDAYLDTSKDTPRIAIHTRTGGGNRDYYEHEDRCRENYPEYFNGDDSDPCGPWNSDLRAVAGFIYDEDDDFDCTYATFYYHVPEAAQALVDTLIDLGANPDQPPADRWTTLLDDLEKRKDTPEAQRALAVGRKIFEQIEATTHD